jgi:alpha-ribazole phosphatase
MSEIFLIRHSTPEIAKGICYGQSDIDVTTSFEKEAAIIKSCLPLRIDQVFSSPLLRCRKLAAYLFPDQEILFENELMEIHCGFWEMKNWDDIPTEEIGPWMGDFVNTRIPGGESYTDLHQRVVSCFKKISARDEKIAVVAHGGVIRSILSFISQTALADSFQAFKIQYGCVIRLSRVGQSWEHEYLSNIPGPAERHKPSYF